MDRWISVKERLPEKEGLYLVTYGTIPNHRYLKLVLFAFDLFETLMSDDGYCEERFKGKPGFYFYGDECGACILEQDSDVIAWMSVPEVYKEDKDE